MQEHHLQKDIDSSVAKLTPLEADQDTELPTADEAKRPLEGKRGETIHIHYFPDAIVMLRDSEESTQENIIDSTVAGTPAPESTIVSTEQTPEQAAEPLLNEKKGTRHTLLTVCFYSLLILSGLTLQSSLPFSSPIATVTLIPKSQTVTFTGMLQLGRRFNPTTVSQTGASPTTGRGHQDAKVAQGTLTFYNGLLTPQTVAAGTVLTSSSGIQIVTTENAAIPPGNPPTYGQATVSAHAMNPGTRGNIPPGDINQACCANAVLAKNTTPFHGGQDERDYQTVTKQDISTGAATLKPAVAQSMQAALHTHLHQSEDIFVLPCAPTVRADHQPDEEAGQVTITVSETCSAVAYDNAALQAKATDLLSHQARQQLGTGYSLLGNAQVTVNQAEVSHAIPTLVFTCQGTWVYALSQEAQEHIKTLLAGKTKQEALQILGALPGIEQASIRWDEQTKLPESPNALHLVILVPTS